jgi:hypothetical protein
MKATILIPDISGFTEFLTQTEIRHSSHIINELLEGIIAGNRLGFHLSEVEGDAVLFYKKGDAVPHRDLLAQCTEMYAHFHQQLKVIERDSICRCGACAGASNLSLKFVVHFGELQEIKISNFLKATGADMIIAHRLLKNGIDKHEYVLLSKPYVEDSGEKPAGTQLNWQNGWEEYASIGRVDYEFTYLDVLKSTIPDPEPVELESPPTPLPSAKEIHAVIEAPMETVYQNLIDTQKRSIWVKGMTTLESQPVAERRGVTHYCLTEGLGLDHTVVSADFQENLRQYVEQVTLRRWGVKVWDYYQVERLDANRSRLSLRFAFRKPGFITRIVEWVVLRNIQKDFAAFKRMCEEGR